MLKSLDVLIGTTTVILIFSMAVTVITQAITSYFGRRGKHLKSGLADLIQQLGIPERQVAESIAHSVLMHPLIADGKGKLGTVIHREEFTRLLMDLAAGNGAGSLEAQAKGTLQNMLQQSGISDPQATLKNVRAMELQLEASNPELANDIRQAQALISEATSDYVARVNSWFDQTIDRVSQRFSHYTHWITLVASAVVVLTIQLDVIAVIDRLSIDDQFRNNVVSASARDFYNESASATTNSQGSTTAGAHTVPNAAPQAYYDLLGKAGLISLPTDRNWLMKLKDSRRYPGMVIAILMISLGAPFWYNILKDLLGLRSALAKKDDLQRVIRQTTQSTDEGATTTIAATVAPTDWLKGERGDLTLVG
jgi:hypothetical protein